MELGNESPKIDVPPPRGRRLVGDTPRKNSNSAQAEKVATSQSSPSPVRSNSSSSSSSSSSEEETPRFTWLIPVFAFLDSHFSWVEKNFVWPKIKPAIRCAVAAWVSFVLFVIPEFEVALGQASFLILIAAILSPPSDPFMYVLERETLILLFVSTAWAWACLGIFLANLARREHNPTATFLEAVSGRYIEAAPSVIMAIFVFFGSAFFLYIKARQGPGPYVFACVFGCICLDISLTSAALFPYPFYLVGRSIVAPLAIHSGLALLSSVVVFPSTISALFTTRLTEVLSPMLNTIDMHRNLLSNTVTAPSFTPNLQKMRAETKKVEGALIPLAAAARLLKSDLIYGRFAPEDFRAFQQLFRRLAGRADGLGVYFGLVDPGRERFPGTANPTPAGTAPGTPYRAMSRATSRAPSLEREGTRGTADEDTHGLGLATSPSRAESKFALTRPWSNATGSLKGSSSLARLQLTHSKSAHSVSASHIHMHHPFNINMHEHGHKHTHSGSHQHHHHHHHHILHSSLLSLAKARSRKPEYAVGTFESQRYLNLELTRLHDPHEEEYTERMVELLKESCDPLLEACHLGISTTQTWFGTVREGRIKRLLGIQQEEAKKRQRERVKAIEEVRDKVKDQLTKFRETWRHMILDPYLPAFDTPDGHYSPAASHPSSPTSGHAHLPPLNANGHLFQPPGKGYSHNDGGAEENPVGKDKDRDVGLEQSAPAHDIKEDDGDRNREHGRRDEYVMPPHRHLFNCYVYHYNLIQVASIVVEILDEILRLEKERPVCKLWTPAERVFLWNPWQLPQGVDQITDDDDPDVIQGIHNTPPPSTPTLGGHEDFHSDLGLPKRRDPDALPPRNLFEVVMRLLYRFVVGLGGGNAIFSLKAGVLTVLLCLPSFIQSSAAFAYENRFVWAIFMGQLTLARFRGETTFGLTARIIMTFFGGLTGMVMWYISCGSGRGNAFGLAAVCLVCFPFFFFARLYWPIPPMSNIVFFVTSALVIGYSYQDLHIVVPGSPGFGFSVFWKRFTLVTVGVVAAFIASFLPPSTTIRRYQRNLLATTMAEMGTVYCNILSFANTKNEPEIQDIVSSLLAVRNKLGKSAMLNTNIIYEFSLRGRWPAERYQKIADLQMALAYSLSHLMSVIEHLEPSWARAFLQRTRFMDPDFQGDILAVISMISLSLRTGTPLPQITPCPLIDRFMLKYHGLDVIHKDSEEDYGLPRTLSVDTLRNEQYLMFSVGISTAYGIINRLDRLMLAAKEVVGEQFHIHGVGFGHALLPASGWDIGGPAGVEGGGGSGGNGHGKGGGSSLRGGGVEMGERTNTVHFD